MRTATVIKELLDKPYELGGKGESYDCLSLILKFYESFGVQFPLEWRGWTRENYAERWIKGEGREEYYEFLCEISDPVDIKFMRERDLIIMRHEGEMWSAFYLGNSHVACVTKEVGIKVLPLWCIKHFIREVKRVK